MSKLTMIKLQGKRPFEKIHLGEMSFVADSEGVVNVPEEFLPSLPSEEYKVLKDSSVSKKKIDKPKAKSKAKTKSK